MRLHHDRVTLRGDGRAARHDQLETVISEWTMGPYHRDVSLLQPVSSRLTNATYGNGCVILAHERRRIIYFNITEYPTVQWITQQSVEAFPLNYLALCDAATGVDSEEAAALSAGIRQVLARQRDQFTLECACHCPDQQRWFLARVTCFEDANALYLVVIHDDITARRQAEDALSESEERYRILAEHILQGISITRNGRRREGTTVTIDLLQADMPHPRMTA